VESVRVKWRDRCDPDVSYLLQKFNEWQEPDGEPSYVYLEGKRFHEIEPPVRDEASYQLFCEAREQQRALEEGRLRGEETKRRELELKDQLGDTNQLQEVRRCFHKVWQTSVHGRNDEVMWTLYTDAEHQVVCMYLCISDYRRRRRGGRSWTRPCRAWRRRRTPSWRTWCSRSSSGCRWWA
jgi:hypothetical protein